MAFDKEAYWRERNMIKEFRKNWYLWLEECKEIYGAQFVHANNKTMFSQRAYAEYLQAELEEQMREEAQRQIQLEAPQPLPPAPDAVLEPDQNGPVVIDMN